MSIHREVAKRVFAYWKGTHTNAHGDMTIEYEIARGYDVRGEYRWEELLRPSKDTSFPRDGDQGIGKKANGWRMSCIRIWRREVSL